MPDLRAVPPVGDPTVDRAPHAGAIFTFIAPRTSSAGQGRRPAPIEGLMPPQTRAAAMSDLTGLPHDGGSIGAQAPHVGTPFRITKPRAAPAEKRRLPSVEEALATPLLCVAAMPGLMGVPQAGVPTRAEPLRAGVQALSPGSCRRAPIPSSAGRAKKISPSAHWEGRYSGREQAPRQTGCHDQEQGGSRASQDGRTPRGRKPQTGASICELRPRVASVRHGPSGLERGRPPRRGDRA